MVTVRAATHDDIENINHILEQSYRKLMSNSCSMHFINAALPFKIQISDAFIKSKRYAVAETVDGKLIGCGGWSDEDPVTHKTEKDVAHVRNYATHPEYIKEGVGRKVFEWCRREAQKEKFKLFECLSGLNAEGFYTSLGFYKTQKRIREIEIRPTVFIDVIHMQYDLNES